MKARFLFLASILMATPVLAQQTVQSPEGQFLCDGVHPRCSTPDPSTYPYYQFALQNVGDYAGISDVLEAGPSLIHYQTFVSELISRRADTNAVSLWADAQSEVNGGRVWGGFISARSDFSSLASPGTADSQLIGLEIDVLNAGLPGVFPNASKVGLQIVGFGNPNTNAIEILTDTPRAAFQNAINIASNSVAAEGAVLGVGAQNARYGINFLNSNFSDAAMLVSQNQKLVFRTAGLSDAAIWRDDINNGYLVLQAGPPGLRVVDSTNSINLMTVTPDGDIVTPLASLSGILARISGFEQGGIGIAADNTAGLAAASATGTGAMAAGPGAVASGNGALALGNSSVATGAESTSLGKGAVATGQNSVAIGNGSTDLGEANVVSVGSGTVARRITNVAGGVGAGDAVNIGQLNRSLDAARSYTDMRLNAFSLELNNLRRDANGATASAMALSAIPQTMEPGRGMVGVGVGTWQGEQAFAFGLSKSDDEGQLVFRLGATYNSRGEGGAAAGAGIAF